MRRPEFLRQAQQAEVIDVHLGARHFDAAARGDAVGAMHLGGVDQDVDLAADFGGRFASPIASRSSPAAAA